MTEAVLIGLTLLVVAALAGFAWRRRQPRHTTAHDEYRRDIPNLMSDRQQFRARRAARAKKRQRFWAAGSAGAVGGYYSDGGYHSDGGGGGCGGGGCGGGGCGGGS